MVLGVVWDSSSERVSILAYFKKFSMVFVIFLLSISAHFSPHEKFVSGAHRHKSCFTAVFIIITRRKKYHNQKFFPVLIQSSPLPYPAADLPE